MFAFPHPRDSVLDVLFRFGGQPFGLVDCRTLSNSLPSGPRQLSGSSCRLGGVDKQATPAQDGNKGT